MQNGILRFTTSQTTLFLIGLSISTTGCLNSNKETSFNKNESKQLPSFQEISNCNERNESEASKLTFNPSVPNEYHSTIQDFFDRLSTSTTTSHRLADQLLIQMDPTSDGVGLSADDSNGCEQIQTVTLPKVDSIDALQVILSHDTLAIIEEDPHDAIEVDVAEGSSDADYGVFTESADTDLGVIHPFHLPQIFWPVKSGIINSNFGYRVHPVTGQKKLHKGTDLKAPQGESVFNGAPGVVQSLGNLGSCGLGVIVKHPNGYQTVYCHLSKILATIGQNITIQNQIGLVGKTGLATGPHLHLGLKLNGTFINPKPHLASR